MNTFTLAFDDWPADERAMAALTAERWQANHQCLVVSQKAILADLPQAVAAMDQPTVDGVNSWYVSRAARAAGLTVALSGVGGDELFAGYPSFRMTPRLKRLPRLGAWLARRPGWYTGWSWLPGSPDMRRKLAAYVARDLPAAHPYFAVRALLTSSQIRDLLQPRASEALQDDASALQVWQQAVETQVARASQYDAVAEVSWLEISQYMRSTLLRDTDMMSMAHSLEVRVPFVDHLLIERILPVRGALKLSGDGPKPLMAAAMRDLLPKPVVGGAKRTFTFPFDAWLRNGLADTLQRQLSDLPESLAGWLSPGGVAAMWRSFTEGHTNWARPWTLYVLCRWAELNL